jgi:alanine dehydrogenase
MSISLPPFTKQQLLPQREKIKGGEKKKRSFIGIPKEIQERRICLTPDAVNSLSFNGHRVMIEAGAGETQLF